MSENTSRGSFGLGCTKNVCKIFLKVVPVYQNLANPLTSKFDRGCQFMGSMGKAIGGNMCDQLSSHPCHLEFQIAVENMCRLALWYKCSINYTHQIWIPPY